MWRAFYENGSLLDLPIAAMIVFMIVFSVVVARALKRTDADDDVMRRLPLEDESTILTATTTRGDHHV